MAVLSICRVFREQWSTLPLPRAVDDVSSKTFVVTGSNVGLGFEASVHLAKMGPELLVATSRDVAKCERTRESIFARVAGAASTQVASWPLDLDSFENVRAFVDRFAAQGNGALHALVANAGVFHPDYALTVDGWEVASQLSVHRVAEHIALAVLGERCSYCRFCLRNSETWSNVLETINSRKFGSGAVRYNVTKLLEVIFVRELAARLPDPTPVVVCTVNPGLCHSELFRAMDDRWYTRWILPAVRKLFFGRTTEEGSRTLVHAAVCGEAHSMHGRYLSSCQVVEESDFIFSPQGKAFSAKLWDETITVLSRVDTRVSEIVSKYLWADA